MTDFTPEERMQYFYEPCKTKEELRLHMIGFLGIDFPDVIIDEDSTSTPLTCVWEIYQVMLTGKGPTKHVVAASRGTAKTMTAAVVRLYAMVHFRRSGTHLAATEDQSKSANQYLDKFLRIPEVAPFVTESNTKTRTLEGMPVNSFTKVTKAQLRVAVATMAGVNSQRGSFNTKDEVDLIQATILSEGALVAEPTQDEHQFDPISLYLSSRKTASGPVQKLLDDQDENPNPRTRIHKWSLVDWMKQCPPDIHRPDLPRIEAWIDDESLKVTWGQENHQRLSENAANKQRHVYAYTGCKSCPAFVACQARSPKQTQKIRYLRGIAFVSDLIDDIKGDADKIIAQVLNLRPESSSIVFRRFNRNRHYLKPLRAWKWLFGEDYVQKDQFDIPSKLDIYKKLVEQGWHINYGVDFGYRPDPAICLIVAYHKRQKRAFILHVDHALDHAPEDWAQYIADNIHTIYPADLVCPDVGTAPKAPIYFRQKQIPSLSKKPSRVETGVGQIRGLLWNVKEQTEKMAVLDDSEYETSTNGFVAESFSKWTHKKGPLGFDYTKFDGDAFGADVCDAARYALDPFIDTQDAKFAAVQPKTQEQVYQEATASGNTDELSKVQKEIESNAKKHFAAHMAEEFGLKGIYETEKKMREIERQKDAPPPEEKPKRKTGMKYSC